MFEINLQHLDHIRRYSVTVVAPSGWEVRLEEDREVRQRHLYYDWHRVERAVAEFEREALALRACGWQVTAA